MLPRSISECDAKKKSSRKRVPKHVIKRRNLAGKNIDERERSAFPFPQKFSDEGHYKFQRFLLVASPKFLRTHLCRVARDAVFQNPKREKTKTDRRFFLRFFIFKKKSNTSQK